MYKLFMGTEFQRARQRESLNHQKAKSFKPVFALSVLSAALCAISISAAAQYADPGQIGNKASWETAEYLSDWGLAAMKASSAYSLGFYGQNVKLGVMDSGALLFVHADLNGDRFHAVSASGQYGTTGIRYPQVALPGDQNPYTAGQSFDVTGQWIQGVNDGHGTHVTGTVGANRNGTGMHGVSWGSNIYVGNTGATDGNNYGPYQDYQFFYTGWKAMVDAGTQVINNSWGTNIRTVDRGTTGPDLHPVTGAPVATGIHLPADTIAETEYEYFYFKKAYGGGPSFVDAAYDAVKDTGTVQVFTTGNRDFKHPFYRALYPYFRPEAEKHWIAVAGLYERVSGGSTTYELAETWNEAGNAKWWTVAAPGWYVNSTTTSGTGVPGYGVSSGTSMSAPHVTGAMGVLLSRYQDMDATQVRDILFTTASNRNPDGTLYKNWTAPDGVPDVRYGWGVPDLEKGMYGPGQLLGHFEYNMTKTPLDVWTNNISQVALDARKLEETQWLQDYRSGTLASAPYELGNSFVVNDGNSDVTDHIIDPADAASWRAEYQAKRAAAIQNKLDHDLYNGSLVKQGEGTLIMTGDNTYRGATTVKEGSLYGFTESFGTGTVSVNGGRFGILSNYNDTFTRKGNLASTQSHKANIDVNNGGTFVMVADENVSVGTLTFKDGSSVTIDSMDGISMMDVYRNKMSLTGSVTADSLTGFEKATKLADYAFFDSNITATGKTLKGTLSRNNNTTFLGYAFNNNERAIAAALQFGAYGSLHDTLVLSTKHELRATYDSLASDMYLNASNASILNTMSVSNTVKNQALGAGSDRTASLAMDNRSAHMSGGDGGRGSAGENRQGGSHNARIWIAGLGNWASFDYGQSDMKVDFYGALIGAEYDLTSRSSAGLFVGAGKTKYKGDNYGKINSNDLHAGIYGIYNAADVASVKYGLTHTNQNRDAERTLIVGKQLGYNSVSNDAKITQIFAEVNYAGFNTEKYSVEPYAGLDLIHLKTDGFTERVGTMLFNTGSSKQSLQVATLGVRGGIPLNASGTKITLKGDLSAMHFFGDATPEAYMTLADSGVAKLRGGKLNNMLNLGLGLEAELKKSSKIEFSYRGSYSKDIKSHGVYLKARINF